MGSPFTNSSHGQLHGFGLGAVLAVRACEPIGQDRFARLLFDPLASLLTGHEEIASFVLYEEKAADTALKAQPQVHHTSHPTSACSWLRENRQL